MEKQRITVFFKQTKLIPAIPPKNRVFYEECLVEQIDKCSNEFCTNEKNRLKLVIKDQEQKLKQVDEAVQTCFRFCNKKKLQIEELNTANQPKSSSQSKSNAEKSFVVNSAQTQSNTTLNVSNSNVCNRPAIMFETFLDSIDSKGLASLRSISACNQNDSKFVLKTVRLLYNNDTKKIASISLTGRSREAEDKNKMSPEKRKIIEGLFTERLNSFGLDATEYSTRNSKVNLHIKNAIGNIKRTKIPTESRAAFNGKIKA